MFRSKSNLSVWLKSLGTAFVFGLFSAPVCADSIGSPRYKLDKNNQVSVLSNLAFRPDCSPSKATGRIVKQEYAKDQISVVGIVLSNKDGTRSYYNIDPDFSEASEVTREWVTKGLQRLTAVGRTVNLWTMLCGAAGRVVMVDRISWGQ